MLIVQRIHHPSKKCFSHIIRLGNDYSVIHTVDTATELDINSVSTKSYSQTQKNSLNVMTLTIMFISASTVEIARFVQLFISCLTST